MKARGILPIGVLSVVLGMSMAAEAAPYLRSLHVGRQAPSPVHRGQSANYGVTVNRAGFGSMNAYLSIEGLPAGTAASFNPAVVKFSDDSPSSKNAVLTVTTSEDTPAGIHPLRVMAQHGSSPRVITYLTALVVEAPTPVITPPVITSIIELPDGTMQVTGLSTPGTDVLIEATFSLSYLEWLLLDTVMTDPVSGIFQFIDMDAGLYPSRFYRAAAPQ